jgi:hypothetical protein
LKPEGRVTVSDIVSEENVPAEVRNNLDAWAGCIGGALEQQEYLKKMIEAGFENVQVVSSKEFYIEGEGSQAPTKFLSITVKAYK